MTQIRHPAGKGEDFRPGYRQIGGTVQSDADSAAEKLFAEIVSVRIRGTGGMVQAARKGNLPSGNQILRRFVRVICPVGLSVKGHSVQCHPGE